MIGITGPGMPGLSDEEFRSIRDYIYRRSGMYFEDSKKIFLEAKLGRRLKHTGAQSFSQYFMEIQKNLENQELDEIFNTVTTTETCFYRNAPQMLAFEKMILPDIAAQKFKTGDTKLRIWSAGCSTGEEPYTLAMIAHKSMNLFPAGFTIEVIASDINQSALQVAKRGSYGMQEIKRLPELLKEKYVVSNGDKFSIADDVRSMVKFKFFNLANGTKYMTLGKMDVIFCRNVLIYFGDAARRRVVDALTKMLPSQGCLFTGYSENIMNMSDSFALQYFNNRPVCYRLKDQRFRTTQKRNNPVAGQETSH